MHVHPVFLNSYRPGPGPQHTQAAGTILGSVIAAHGGSLQAKHSKAACFLQEVLLIFRLGSRAELILVFKAVVASPFEPLHSIYCKELSNKSGETQGPLGLEGTLYQPPGQYGPMTRP